MTTSTDTTYCPSCDVRAIGMEPREGEQTAAVTPWRLLSGDELLQCEGCGCVFNPGTTRQFGGRTLPISVHTLRWYVVTGRGCTCDEPVARLIDVNFNDALGREQRVHGVRCDTCLGWVQVG